MRVDAFVIVALTLAACGTRAPPAAPVARERLADVAMGGFEEELRARGYQVGARAKSAETDAVVASRDSSDWYFLLGVESSSAEQGPKWMVRLSVFREPGRQLSGEVAPYSIATGDALGESDRRALVHALGKRAAEQFAQNFGPH